LKNHFKDLVIHKKQDKCWSLDYIISAPHKSLILENYKGRPMVWKSGGGYLIMLPYRIDNIISLSIEGAYIYNTLDVAHVIQQAEFDKLIGS
jgi:hypothetical protein